MRNSDRHALRRRRTRPGRGGGRPLEHGLKALERRLKTNALDGRCQTARMLQAIAFDLAKDRGGLERCSQAEVILIERAAALAVLCSSIETYVFRQGTPIAGDGGLLAVLRKGYTSHVSALTRLLVSLGLERRASEPESLAAYLARREQEHALARASAPKPAATDPAATVAPAGDGDRMRSRR